MNHESLEPTFCDANTEQKPSKKQRLVERVGNSPCIQQVSENRNDMIR